jgi:hypothetical protein
MGNPYGAAVAVAVEDGSEFAKQAWDALAAKGRPVVSLSEFLKRAEGAVFSTEDRLLVVNQSIAVFEQLFVHAADKKERFRADPVARLRGIGAAAATLSQTDFHEAMMRAFDSVRDIHTRYLAPEPWSSATAFLPFRLECYTDYVECVGLGGTVQRIHHKDTHNPRRHWHYLVSKVLPTASKAHEYFVPGAEILRFNGLLVPKAEKEELDEGALGPASRAGDHAALRLTVNPLGTSPLVLKAGNAQTFPYEYAEECEIEYVAPGSNQVRAIRFP